MLLLEITIGLAYIMLKVLAVFYRSIENVKMIKPLVYLYMMMSHHLCWLFSDYMEATVDLRKATLPMLSWTLLVV